jgi:hypothetical protein
MKRRTSVALLCSLMGWSGCSMTDCLWNCFGHAYRAGKGISRRGMFGSELKT